MIKQGDTVFLTDMKTGKSTKYVLWNLVIKKEDDSIFFELKHPTPNDTVDYTLSFANSDPKKKRHIRHAIKM